MVHSRFPELQHTHAVTLLRRQAEACA